MADRFVSEKELEEAKKRRQEEWEKVRKPTDPEEVPEEEVDNRPLYDRLKEVRDKKQAEYEEEHRLKNMVRGLDADECDFLSKVDDLKAKHDLEKIREEKALLSEIERAQARQAVEENMPSVSDLKVKPTTSGSPPKENKQAAILRSAIKRKSDLEMEKKCIEKRPALTAIRKTYMYPSALKVVGILPGMVEYTSSSSSTSDSDPSDTDSSCELPILPVLIQPDQKEDKKKQLSDSDSDY